MPPEHAFGAGGEPVHRTIPVMSISFLCGRGRALPLLALLVAPLIPGSFELVAATVSTLDGRVLSSGMAPAFDAKAGTVSIGGSTLALADCDWIEPGSGVGVAIPSGKTIGVWLADGSWLPAMTLAAGEADNSMTITGPLGTMSVPLASLLGWSAGPDLPGPRSERIATDQVLLDSGLVTGRIEGLAEGKLLVRLDLDPGKTQPFALEQVRGLRLAIPAHADKGIRLAVTLNDAQPALRVVVARSGTSDGALALAAAPSVMVGRPLANARLRIEGGRRVYLGDLTPDKVDEVGAFGVVWPWQRDRNIDGSPLRMGGTRYDRGLVVHSQARMSWKLQGGYTHLHALAGISDAVGEQGDCAAALIVDGRTAWSRDSIKGGDKVIPIELELAGAQSLELRVDYGARYDIGDHFALADAFVVKAK